MIYLTLSSPCDSPSYCEINLGNIEYNTKVLTQWLGPKTHLMAVVKDDAYGHGAVPTAKAALCGGAQFLAVQTINCAIKLRKNSIDAPILLLGYFPPVCAPTLVKYDIRPTISTKVQASSLAREAQRRGIKIPIHINVDTGMARMGLPPSEVLSYIKYIKRLRGLQPEGIYTHFATADQTDKTFARRQLERFQEIVGELEDRGVSFPLKHVANTAAILDMPETHMNMVRCGIGLYGILPSPHTVQTLVLKPALTLKSRIIKISTLAPGCSIGYGRTFFTDRITKVGLIPLGYGHGYPRSISNKGEILCHGRRVPIIGTISMDHLTVDVTDIYDARTGDPVVAIGEQQGNKIDIHEVAHWANTIPYEILVSIGKMCTRVYISSSENA